MGQVMEGRNGTKTWSENCFESPLRSYLRVYSRGEEDC
jgi:hypothetical protein